METANRDFQTSNREQANQWISEFTPKVVLPDSKKELWVLAMEERKREYAERMRIFHSVEPMPFELWLEDVQEVERAVFGARLIHDEPTHFGHSGEAPPDHENGHVILKRMSRNANRGQISRHERDVAQQVALANLRRHWGKTRDDQKGFDALALEVRNGECTLGEHNGAIVRIVGFTVYSVTHKGTILTELGTFKSGKCYGKVGLPDSKQYNFDTAQETIRQDMLTFLAPFRPGMQIGDIEYSEYTQTHESYGKTTYHKSVQHATMTDGFDQATLHLPVATYINANEVPQVCRQYHAFCLRVKDRLKLYAWLKQEDFDFFMHKAEGKSTLGNWTDQMSVDEAAALEALAWTAEGQNNKPTLQVRASVLDSFKSRFKSSQAEVQKTSQEKDETAKRPAGLAANVLEVPAVKTPEEQKQLLFAKRRSCAAAARVVSKSIASELRVSDRDDGFSRNSFLAQRNQDTVEAVLGQCRSQQESTQKHLSGSGQEEGA